MTDRDIQQKSDRLVIGITGRIGAGKTSVAKYLSSAYGFHYTRYSQVLSDWLAQDPESKAALQVVGWEVMAGGMQGELNTRLVSKLPVQRDCAVDGLRHPLDYETLHNSFPRFSLVFVRCSPVVRWQRLKLKNPERFATQDDLHRAESHPVEQHIDSLRSQAFITLDNEDSLQNLYSKVDVVLRTMRPGATK